jgi:serine/threonine protein kinase
VSSQSLARITEEAELVDAETLTPLDRLARLTRLKLSLVHVQRRWHRKKRGTEDGEDALSTSIRTTFHHTTTELQGIVSSRISQMQEFIAELDHRIAMNQQGDEQLAASLTSKAIARPLQTGINDFRLLRALNSGTYAHVWLAQKTTTGDVYALKAIRVDVTTLKNQGRLSEQEASLGIEQSILFRHTSPFLVRCFFSFHSAKHILYR